jgi:ABC-2 type transport system permease protein
MTAKNKKNGLPSLLHNFPILYEKEIYHYFFNPSAYVVIAVFLIISGYFFANSLFINNQATIVTFTDIAPLLFTFFIPALTMRLFSEEYKTATIEILFTNPVTPVAVTLAKIAAAMTVITITLLLTLTYPVTVSFLGNIDLSAVWCAYLGLFLTSLVFSCIGTFASVLTKNQVTAFIIGFMLCFTLYIIGKVTPFMPDSVAVITDFAGIDSHLNNLILGIIDSRDIVYYTGLSVFFVFIICVKIKISRYE